MIRKDYHGFTLKDALMDVESVISAIRLKGKRDDAEFVVGNGVIKPELIDTLKIYGLEPRTKLGNDGIVVCVIE